MKRRYLEIDVFGAEPSLGNALGVVLDSEDLTADAMQGDGKAIEGVQKLLRSATSLGHRSPTTLQRLVRQRRPPDPLGDARATTPHPSPMAPRQLARQ